MSISLRLNDTGVAVADLQRKLASLDRRDVPEIAALQQQRCAVAGGAPCGVYDTTLEAAINGFKRRYDLGPEDGVCDTATWHELNLQAGSVFSEVWQYELDALTGPVPDGVTPARPDLPERAHAQQLAGLAFSGGGIRSATFNLGILQALAELRVLRNFDYLSTVSGGGYIGAWFSRWLGREHGRIDALEAALTPGAPDAPHGEADEIKFLRQYTNYLAPRAGFFSADTWALLATYVRNTTLNMTILIALLAAVMVVPRLLATLVNIADHGRLPGMPPGVTLFSSLALVCVLWAVGMIAANIASRPDRTQRHLLLGQGQFNVILFIVLPLMVAGCAGSIALWDHRDAIEAAVRHRDPALLEWIFAAGVVYFCAWALGWGAAQRHNARHRPAGAPPASLALRAVLVDGVGHFLCAVIALAVGTGAVIALTAWLAGWAGGGAEKTVPVVAFGMPVLCSTFGFTMVLCVGLVGRRYSDQSREWWSRQSGWTTIIVSGWVALVALSLYAPGLLAWIHAQSRGWISTLLATGWFGTTLAGLLVGRSSRSGGDIAGAPAGRVRLDWLARLAPLVFSGGALCLVSTGLQHALPGAAAPLGGEWPLGEVLAAYDAQTLAVGWPVLAIVACFLAGAGALMAWRVDINKFSLHMMYRNRLVRAYLGASNTAREPHPFTGFDPADDLEMAALLRKGAVDDVGAGMQRPCHIVNTALNLVKGAELAWQTRKAAGFAFTPAFCGFELPRMAAPGGARLAQEALRGCFRPTAFYSPPGKIVAGEEGGIRLGMAMAVSGAAASPNMGFHSSPPLAFLMTLFNVRLGRWFANPTKLVRRPAQGKAAAPPSPPPTSPPVGLWYLLRELFGLTDARSNYLYLSDGAHFENLGVYELVRRRCRLVVVVDAGADGQFDFSDLGNAIRKCATDLCVDIEIDVSRIEVIRQTEFSGAHCVTGRIRYDKIDRGGVAGTLLYIKPSLTGTEFADILNYRKTNKAFPHQSTADQWFDETQFETYRSLGYSIGKIVMADAVAASVPKQDASGRLDIASLCAALHARWDVDMRAATATAPAKKLVLVSDRRQGERRRAAEDATPERRRSERRA